MMKLTKSELLILALVVAIALLALQSCDADPPATPQASAAAAPGASAAPAGELTTATLAVTGMHCESCSQFLTKLLGEQPGVAGVSADFATGIVKAGIDPTATDAATLAALINEKSSYKAAVADSATTGSVESSATTATLAL